MTRRVTVTLPDKLLRQARRIARQRRVSPNCVISELVIDGLRKYEVQARSEQVFNAYQKAFGGFSEDELMLLDGVVLKPQLN